MLTSSLTHCCVLQVARSARWESEQVRLHQRIAEQKSELDGLRGLSSGAALREEVPHQWLSFAALVCGSHLWVSYVALIWDSHLGLSFVAPSHLWLLSDSRLSLPSRCNFLVSVGCWSHAVMLL